MFFDWGFRFERSSVASVSQRGCVTYDVIEGPASSSRPAEVYVNWGYRFEKWVSSCCFECWPLSALLVEFKFEVEIIGAPKIHNISARGAYCANR